MTATIRAEQTAVFPRFLDLAYPSIERGEGVWLFTTDGRRILDACSGGAMTSCLGYGVVEVINAAAAQANEIAYYYNHHFTNRPQEELAERLVTEVAPEMARVKFTSGGSEANEAAIRLARAYHVERGQPQRWRVISPAQAYHGSTFGTLALSGRRRSLQQPYEKYLPDYVHIPPATPRLDPTGDRALAELDSLLENVGPDSISAFFCEPVSAAALPAYSPPTQFWEGLKERARRYGFLICFDEIVSGMGRVGRWLAAHELPLDPDIVTIGKGLGAGYAPLAAVLCRQHVFDAIAGGSREFDLGHTWDGAPLPCAVGLAVLDVIHERRLVERVRERGWSIHGMDVPSCRMSWMRRHRWRTSRSAWTCWSARRIPRRTATPGTKSCSRLPTRAAMPSSARWSSGLPRRSRASSARSFNSLGDNPSPRRADRDHH